MDWCPPWSVVQVRDSGRDLGFVVGPGHGEESWAEPLRKAWCRVGDWDWASLGLQYAARVWNSYVLPVLLFVAQLEPPPPPAAVQAQTARLRREGHGPGNWCSQEDLHHLRSAFGFSAEFRDLRVDALAARARMARWEDHTRGGIRAERRWEALRRGGVRKPLWPRRLATGSGVKLRTFIVGRRRAQTSPRRAETVMRGSGR